MLGTERFAQLGKSGYFTLSGSVAGGRAEGNGGEERGGRRVINIRLCMYQKIQLALLSDVVIGHGPIQIFAVPSVT
ncbi:Zinc finger protein VAR3, chloroplastic [Dirofilaria immitis]